MAQDILIDTQDNDLLISAGDFGIDESTDQEVAFILMSEQGEWKEDPLVGAGLFRLVNSNGDERDLKQLVKLQLARDKKNYEQLKKRINLKLNENA